MPTHDAMRYYMRDIGDTPLVTVAEEGELAKRIKRGDKDALDQLVRANLRLVVKIAHDFKGLGLPLQDLISEGNIGLMRAAEKFDPAKGAKFSSYAAWWIKQNMRRAIAEKSKTIRIPIASAAKMKKIKIATSIMTDELGREPTTAEIAVRLEFSERVVRRLQRSDHKTISLQDPIIRGEDGELNNLIPDESNCAPDQALDERESAQRLRQLFQGLDQRECTILLMRYGLDGKPPRTLEEISKHIGRTRERVRQIQKRALKKLRTQMGEDYQDVRWRCHWRSFN
jgi:RNA polymerase primary sigma factor